MLDEDRLLDKYVKSYYLRPDIILDNNGEILNNWKLSPTFEAEVELLLTLQGWRNRTISATVIGGLKLERFLNQIFNQALQLNEIHSAKSYSFALTRIHSNKSVEYLKALSFVKVNSSYSEEIQKFYKAGLFLTSSDNLIEHQKVGYQIDYLRNRIYKWENYSLL
jgi:hypothetical protein